jgi:hypothetical protein
MAQSRDALRVFVFQMRLALLARERARINALSALLTCHGGMSARVVSVIT